MDQLRVDSDYLALLVLVPDTSPLKPLVELVDGVAWGCPDPAVATKRAFVFPHNRIDVKEAQFDQIEHPVDGSLFEKIPLAALSIGMSAARMELAMFPGNGVVDLPPAGPVVIPRPDGIPPDVNDLDTEFVRQVVIDEDV